MLPTTPLIKANAWNITFNEKYHGYLYFIPGKATLVLLEFKIAKNIKLKWWWWEVIIGVILLIDVVILELVE